MTKWGTRVLNLLYASLRISFLFFFLSFLFWYFSFLLTCMNLLRVFNLAVSKLPPKRGANKVHSQFLSEIKQFFWAHVHLRLKILVFSPKLFEPWFFCESTVLDNLFLIKVFAKIIIFDRKIYIFAKRSVFDNEP